MSEAERQDFDDRVKRSGLSEQDFALQLLLGAKPKRPATNPLLSALYLTLLELVDAYPGDTKIRRHIEQTLHSHGLDINDYQAD